MAKVEKSIVIAAPPEKIWEVAADPSGWHTWFEGASEPKSVQGDGGVGTVVEHGITVAKIPLPATTEVVEYEPGVRWKAEFHGPANKGYMQWDYAPEDGGTKVTFTIEAELSGPAKLAEKMVVKSFESMADKTLANLKKMAES